MQTLRTSAQSTARNPQLVAQRFRTLGSHARRARCAGRRAQCGRGAVSCGFPLQLWLLKPVCSAATHPMGSGRESGVPGAAGEGRRALPWSLSTACDANSSSCASGHDARPSESSSKALSRRAVGGCLVWLAAPIRSNRGVADDDAISETANRAVRRPGLPRIEKAPLLCRSDEIRN